MADVTALAEKSRQKLLAEAEQLILSGKEMGITRSEYISVIDRLTGRGIQMIELKDLDKAFDNIHAVDQCIRFYRERMVFGLIGSNGAGKKHSSAHDIRSHPSGRRNGSHRREPVFENPEAKSLVCFLSDTPYYFPGADIRQMRDYYGMIYPAFNRKLFDSLTAKFRLDSDGKSVPFQKEPENRYHSARHLCRDKVSFLRRDI